MEDNEVSLIPRWFNGFYILTSISKKNISETSLKISSLQLLIFEHFFLKIKGIFPFLIIHFVNTLLEELL